MLHAVTRHTAAELITTRANATAPNMGLTSWQGVRVRKGDVVTAKNYLAEGEVSDLNLIVTMFLDTAELMARRRQTIRLADWDSVLDNFLRANEMPVLSGAGSRSHKQAVAVAEAAYDTFDETRKLAERAADAAIDELDELKKIAEFTRKKGKT